MTEGRTATDNERHRTIDEIFAIQPGLARLMPDVGARYWKCWYAAQAGNWKLADWQLKELKKLLRVCIFTRPKYIDDLEEFIRDDLAPVTAAIAAEDFAAFDATYRAAVDRANWFHEKWNKDFIVWRLPDSPPPDLDLTPR